MRWILPLAFAGASMAAGALAAAGAPFWLAGLLWLGVAELIVALVVAGQAAAIAADQWVERQARAARHVRSDAGHPRLG